MAEPLASLVLTGASGFIGRNLLAAAQDRYRVYAIARRPQQRCGVPDHPNLRWIQVDIGNRDSLERVTAHIRREGGADCVLHLAAHFDFDYRDHPEYRRTNIDGTRNVLEQARALGARHFVFASSLAACRLPLPGDALTEESPPDADFPYARSKRIGEEMVRGYSRWFRCSIVRLAAVYSDFCEHPPLYVFLETWLGQRWNSRILGGRGDSAVPYIHTRDVVRLFALLLHRGAELPRCGVYLGSPDGATSQRELFELATRVRFGRAVRPICVPRELARYGLAARDLLGRVSGSRPFERPWMADYIDTRLAVDAAATRAALGWMPTPRFHITRRLLFLIEKMRSDPREWAVRNERAMKRPSARPALIIHDAMVEAREAIVDGITSYLLSPARGDRFPNHARLGHDELRWYVGIVYELLTAAVRTGERTLLLHYIHDLARRRFETAFPPSEVCDALLVISEVTVAELCHKPRLADLRPQVRDAVALSVALAIDGVQDAYQAFAEAARGAGGAPGGEGMRDLEAIVEELNAFYRPAGDAAPGGVAVRDLARSGGR